MDDKICRIRTALFWTEEKKIAGAGAIQHVLCIAFMCLDWLALFELHSNPVFIFSRIFLTPINQLINQSEFVHTYTTSNCWQSSK